MARSPSRPPAGDSPFERIVETARELFAEQGFAGTTVNELIEAAGTHKASFYRYFQSKEDVAVEYLNREERSFLESIRPLLERARDPADFVRRWCRLLRKQVRNDAFQGCRVSRLLQSLEKDPGDLRRQSAAVIDHWIAALASFFQRERAAGRFRGDPERTAEKFIRLFQGTAAMYRLHGRADVFLYLEEDMLREVGADS